MINLQFAFEGVKVTEKNNKDIKVAKKSKRKKVEDVTEYSEGKLIINSTSSSAIAQRLHCRVG